MCRLALLTPEPEGQVFEHLGRATLELKFGPGMWPPKTVRELIA